MPKEQRTFTKEFKRELDIVRQERDLLKSYAHLLEGTQMKYRVIARYIHEYTV